MIIALYKGIAMVTIHLISCMLLLYGAIMVSISFLCDPTICFTLLLGHITSCK